MKFVHVLLWVGPLLAIYDIPSMLNPTKTESYSRINGGIGSQNYWSGFLPRSANTFDPTMAGYKAMYNLNSLAPFNGDRYTGYDAMSQRWAPPGTASTFFNPVPAGISEQASYDKNLMDFNSILYRNFYDRYYEFYHKNLNLLNSKINIRNNPHAYDRKDSDHFFNPDNFDPLKNYFSGSSRKKALYGPNIPDMKIQRVYSFPSDPALAPSERLLTQASAHPVQTEKVEDRVKAIRRLRGKVTDLKKALSLIGKVAARRGRVLAEAPSQTKLDV